MIVCCSTLDTTLGICVTIGNRIFQIAGWICSGPFAMFSLTNITYILTTSYIAYSVIHSPLTVSPSVHHRPVMALIGSMMVGTFAAYPLWPKPELKLNNNRGDTTGAAGVTNSKSL
jgi:hypothetical protein